MTDNNNTNKNDDWVLTAQDAATLSMHHTLSIVFDGIRHRANSGYRDYEYYYDWVYHPELADDQLDYLEELGYTVSRVVIPRENDFRIDGISIKW